MSQHTKNILVMWSGGIDSTYTLAKLLAETDHNIFAHHIELKNVEGRDIAERNAVLKLIPKLKQIRDFKLTANFIDDSKMPTIVYDMARVCFEAGAVSKAFYHYSEPVILDEWTIGTHKDEGHWQERWDIISHATRAAEWSPERKTYMKFFLGELVTKTEEIEYLSNLGLLFDTWFCRTPTKNGCCNKCKTCIEVSQALKKTSKIGTIVRSIAYGTY